MSKQILIVAIMASLLTACGQGQGLGVTSGSSSQVGAGMSSSVGTSQALDASKGSKASISVPASALIADAAREIVAVDGVDLLQMRANLMSFARETEPRLSALMMIVGAGVAANETREGFSKAATHLRTLDKTPAQTAVIAEKLRCAELGAAGKTEDARLCYAGYYVRVGAAATIVLAHQPRAGWEVSPMGPKHDKKTVNAYITTWAALVETAALVESEIVRVLGPRSLRDPDAAHERIGAALFAMSPDQIIDLETAAMKTVTQGLTDVTIDLASGRGIGWRAGATTYVGDASGWIATRNGVTWFGEGKINGKAYDLALESSLSARQSKSSQTQSTQHVDAGTTAGSGAAVR